MNVKQIFLTLIVLFTVDSVAMSQVKKQYRDDADKSVTVVIKEDGANDFDILHSQFNLDDYEVNEQIKITTDHSLAPASGLSNNVSGGKPMLPPAPDLANATASTTSTYERPKTKMKRWSVREKSSSKTSEEISIKVTEEKLVTDTPATVTAKPSRTKSTGNAKRASSGKYKKKSKKARKKKRVRKLKNRKKKIRRNKKGACYKF